MKYKCYKPGQLVTIEGRVYRIKKNSHHVPTCFECVMLPHFCHICSKIYVFCKKNIPYECYLELVK